MRDNTWWELYEMFKPDPVAEQYGYGWFNHDDKIDSMRSAILIRLMRDIVCDARSGHMDTMRDLKAFFADVLAKKPHHTKSRQIIDLVAAAADMVSRGSADERIALRDAFVVSDRAED